MTREETGKRLLERLWGSHSPLFYGKHTLLNGKIGAVNHQYVPPIVGAKTYARSV